MAEDTVTTPEISPSPVTPQDALKAHAICMACEPDPRPPVSAICGHVCVNVQQRSKVAVNCEACLAEELVHECFLRE